MRKYSFVSSHLIYGLTVSGEIQMCFVNADVALII
jgi:hypothetical protein